jgi:hypothetical protein
VGQGQGLTRRGRDEHDAALWCEIDKVGLWGEPGCVMLRCEDDTDGVGGPAEATDACTRVGIGVRREMVDVGDVAAVGHAEL